jgi:hypothetical protein
MVNVGTLALMAGEIFLAYINCHGILREDNWVVHQRVKCCMAVSLIWVEVVFQCFLVLLMSCMEFAYISFLDRVWGCVSYCSFHGYEEILKFVFAISLFYSLLRR